MKKYLLWFANKIYEFCDEIPTVKLGSKFRINNFNDIFVVTSFSVDSNRGGELCFDSEKNMSEKYKVVC